MKFLFGLLIFIAGWLSGRAFDPGNPDAAVAVVLVLLDILVMVCLYAAKGLW